MFYLKLAWMPNLQSISATEYVCEMLHAISYPGTCGKQEHSAGGFQHFAWIDDRKGDTGILSLIIILKIQEFVNF